MGMMVYFADKIFTIYGVLIIIRVLLSWVPSAGANPFTDIIHKLTEPVIGPCRELLNAVFGVFGIDVRTFPLDFSPFLAYLLVEGVIRRAVLSLLTILF